MALNDLVATFSSVINHSRLSYSKAPAGHEIHPFCPAVDFN